MSSLYKMGVRSQVDAKHHDAPVQVDGALGADQKALKAAVGLDKADREVRSKPRLTTIGGE